MSRKKELWRYEWVLARRNKRRGYGPKNCYWRKAKTEKEARMGIEEWFDDEPEIIPFSEEHWAQRCALPERQKQTFDIWHRILWRAEASKEMEMN